MSNRSLSAIESYLKPSIGSTLFVSFMVGLAIIGWLASGNGFAIIFAVIYGVFLLIWWSGYTKSTEQAAEQPVLYASRYGVDVLCDDFANAKRGVQGDDFRLGKQFLYSRCASKILAYSEIESVTTSVSRNLDSADDYDIDIHLFNSYSPITISSHQSNWAYITVIESHVRESHKNAKHKGAISEQRAPITLPLLSPDAKNKVKYALQYSTNEGMTGHLTYIRNQLAPEEQEALSVCLNAENPRTALAHWVFISENPISTVTASKPVISDPCTAALPARQYSLEELDMLQSLYQEGTITEEEYQQCLAGQENR